ncbi:MAG: hypothetical protein COY66_03175 [Candidatus Kerfeldbacteria bacterium CG_4_10_14_0_8_um_filter_42_10]|uniref:RapZ C-terminal domain-containing protein n=1 Tax=Candidatus Kerfeldbacteria bacterium CG_4_10_14_0_8_um_filter_42_10 TaxID=2014248 RepID=A0A2M7RK28_9BACT|nr:MAG: hypothetical protein COY66_03175 [Candidatus Kerfeldbacteria bacterium CG_4_10_14_0_8_um_filter_42_10]
MEKIIEVCSLSEHRIAKGFLPPVPDSTTLQFQFDVRILPDSIGSFPNLPGTNPAVREFVRNQPITQILLLQIKVLLCVCLDAFRTSDQFTVLRLCFLCAGGFQRSVAFAEEMAAWLKEQPGGFPVKIRHFRLEQDAQR